MKHLLILALVVLICGAAYAQGVPSQSNPRLMVDSAGNLVSTTNPLPVTGTLTVTASGTTTTLPGPYTTVQVSAATAGATAATVASLAARLVVRITNIGTETVWIAENSTAATVSAGLPLLSNQVYEERLGPAIPVSYIASTPTAVTLFQGK